MIHPLQKSKSVSLFLLLGIMCQSSISTASPPVSKHTVPTPTTTQLEPVRTISVMPARVAIHGPYDEIHLLVDGKSKSGSVYGLLEHVSFSVLDKKIALVDSSGVVRGLKDGKTVLTAKYLKKSSTIPVEVQGIDKPLTPRFVTDIMPVLTKAGCNSGACHGAGAGKGGMKLSLLGYDPDADFEIITRGAGARRVSPAQPENSLLLRKPTFTVNHKGGQRFTTRSTEYRLIRDWIAADMPGPTPKEPKLIGLEVIPTARTMRIGQKQQFTIWAKYKDGSRRDTTGQTLFSASDESVAGVTTGGEAKVNGPGEGAVIARYQGLVSTGRVISPFKSPIMRSSEFYRNAGKLDTLVSRKLDSLGLKPSPKCSDSDFLRRAYLDVIGVTPSPDEARAFLADIDPLKRDKLIQMLLNRPEYADYWTLRWGDILRCSRTNLGDKGMASLNSWIHDSVESNKRWDQFARELLLAQGSSYTNGAANYYRSATSPQALTEATSQIFLGVRIECAKCHNHPYERWTQNQYYQMSAFFARLGNKPGERTGENVLFLAKAGEVRHPKTQKEVAPTALDAEPVPADFKGDRRAVLVDWLTSSKNPYFAHELVNRLWKHFMGRGLVEPVDDMRATNPPSNSALFDALSDDFTGHGFDLKYLIGAIMRTEAYQRAPEPVFGNERDTRFYSHYPFKRIDAEPLMDAISSATGVWDKFDGYPAGMRATQLPDTAVSSYFLDLFGRPARNIVCECERSDDPSLGQILHLMNDKAINAKIADKTGRVAKLIVAKASNDRILEDLYLSVYSRFPTIAERKQGVKALVDSKNLNQSVEDILWALLNSKEFVFNH